ncbi:MAG: NAD-dependent epimerase/dehydratase family protein, partial [Bryobacteraceae bacterium]
MNVELGAGEIGVRILLVGGSGFIGRFVVQDLLAAGHEIAVFHRGLSGRELPPAVQRIIGDHAEIERYRAGFERFAPDVVVDFILSGGRQAQALAATVRGIAGRVVAISSQDVYRACGILHGSEPGPLQ